MSRTQCRPLPPITEETRLQIQKLIRQSPGEDDCWPWMGCRTSRGYGTIRIAGQMYYVTRIVHFIKTGEDPFPLEMRHSCDNPPCCRFKHLLTGTHQENMQDAMDRKRMASGDRNGSRTHSEKLQFGPENHATKIPDAEVEQIRLKYASGRNCVDIAREYNCSPSAIVHIVRGNRRRHLPGPIQENLSKATNVTLTDDKVKYLLRRRSEGATFRELEIELGVTQGAIVPILDGRTWKHIPREGYDFKPRKAHLTPEQHTEIQQKRARGKSVAELAVEYNSSLANIYAILNRR